MSRPFMPTCVKSPCHDYINDCDCSKRSIGCHCECAKWAAYVEERDKRYEQRAEQVCLNNALSEMHDIRRCRHSNVVEAFRTNRGTTIIKECKA